MSIEKNLEALASNTGRIADALEKLLSTTALTTSATAAEAAATAPAAEEPKKPAPKTPPKKTPPPPPPAEEEQIEEEQQPEVDPLDDDQPPFEQEATFTPDEVRAALRTYRDVEGDGAMMAVLKSFGATGMGSLKEADYAAVMAKVR